MNVQTIQGFQRSEITEHIIYQRLSQRVRGKNDEIVFISLGVALASFVIGWVARMVLKVEF